MPAPVKVLIVGQTPPPYHGQAIMIERLLRAPFSRVQLFHVRMDFSESIGDVGRLQGDFGDAFILVQHDRHDADDVCGGRDGVLDADLRAHVS